MDVGQVELERVIYKYLSAHDRRAYHVSTWMFRAINTCVLGVGLSGLTFHIPFILALPGLFTLQSVLERNPKSQGGKVKERFGIDVKIHTSFEDVLVDPAIELLIIGTPSDTHYCFAKAALEAGKHGARSH